MLKGYRIALVGASTPVGRELVRLLEERGFPALEVVALEPGGSLESPGEYLGSGIPVRPLDEAAFKGMDLAFFASGPGASVEFARGARRQGTVVIDLTAAFRLAKDVPLVIPELDPRALPVHDGIIACPSPGAVQMALVLAPIHRKAGVRRVVASVYQAVSDAGEGAMDELTGQITGLLNFQDTTCSVFPHRIAFNVIPQAGIFLENGYTSDEMGIMLEMQKLLRSEDLKISVTTARVPVFYSHAQSLSVETDRKISPAEVRRLLASSPGVMVEDRPAEGVYPLPMGATGKDECFAGRIRRDLSRDNGVALWTSMDNVRKGAALNAVQIAEQVIASRDG